MSPSVDSAIRIVLVDDHALFRTGLRLLCEREPDFQIVGEAGNIQEAIAVAAREQPDLILLDVDLAGVSALDILRELEAAAPATRIVVLTGVRDDTLPAQALQGGARGFVYKEDSAELVCKAVRKVSAGELWFRHGTVAATISQLLRRHSGSSNHTAEFSARERDIITLVGAGLPNGEIAQRLGISEKTVRNHLTVIFEKADVADRLHLAIYGYRHGLAKFPTGT